MDKLARKFCEGYEKVPNLCSRPLGDPQGVAYWFSVRKLPDCIGRKDLFSVKDFQAKMRHNFEMCNGRHGIGGYTDVPDQGLRMVFAPMYEGRLPKGVTKESKVPFGAQPCGT